MPLLPKNLCETITMDFDSLIKVKSGLGTAGVVVINKDQDIIKCISRLARFYKHESCGQCTPCREGSTWMKKITARLVAGEASPDDLDTLESVAYQIDGRTICAFGEACAWPVESMIDKFRDELLAETVEGNAQSPRNAEQEAQRRYLKDAVAYADKP